MSACAVVRIEVGRGLVEHQHGRIGQERAREREPLPLTARELRPLLADQGVEPVRERGDPLVRAARSRSASSRSASEAAGRASLRFARIVESKTCASWPASANCRRTSSCRYSRTSRPSIVTRPCSGSRKRRSRFMTVVFPAPLGPTSAIAAARFEAKVDTAERRPLVGVRTAPSRLPVPRSPGAAEVGAAPGIHHRGPAVDQLENAPAGGERGREFARRRRERGDRVERREGEQRERRHEHAVERRPRRVADTATARTPTTVRPGDEDRERVAEPGGERVAAAEARELALRRARRARASPPHGRRRRARERRAGARRARR